MISLRISKSYKEKQVFDNFALDIHEGEILCVLGESGGGKTTLLNILAGLIPYDGEVKNAPQNVGFIFQEPRLLPNLTVEGNLLYAGGRYEFMEEILRKTELISLRNKRPKELSGGELRRMAIARALIMDPDVILADEPTGDLDEENTEIVLGIFKEQAEKGKAVFLVTHDRDTFDYADRRFTMRSGNIEAVRDEAGPAE